MGGTRALKEKAVKKRPLKFIRYEFWNLRFTCLLTKDVIKHNDCKHSVMLLKGNWLWNKTSLILKLPGFCHVEVRCPKESECAPLKLVSFTHTIGIVTCTLHAHF